MNKNLRQRFFGSSVHKETNFRLSEQEGYYRNQEGFWEITLHHFFPQTSPDMIWWWLNHLDSPENQRVLKFRGVLQLNKSEIRSSDTGHISSSFDFSYKLPFFPLKFQSALIAEGLKSAMNNREYMLEFSNKNSNNLIRYTCQAKWHAYDSGSEISVKYLLPGNLPEFIAILLYNYNYNWQRRMDEMIPQLYSRQAFSRPFAGNSPVSENGYRDYNFQLP